MSLSFTSPTQMEPLLIGSGRPGSDELLGLAHELSEASAVLEGKLNTRTAQSLSNLVVGMNCYYSNLIEGHPTLPVDIAQAMKIHGAREQRNLRSLSSAHIEADQWARRQDLLSVGILPFVSALHRIFVENLPASELRLENGKVIKPGKFRFTPDEDVIVGLHHAPNPATLNAFLERFAQVYTQTMCQAAQGGALRLHAIASCFMAHHRFVWIHPFMDGNGRVARILLDAMLRSCGLNQTSVWSMSRGFAKSHAEYINKLAGADLARQGDYDGRGNLSEKKLLDWCVYSMNTAKDQASFMTDLFGLNPLRKRVEQYFQIVRVDLKPESAKLIMHALTEGEFDRMEAGRVTGMPERTARQVLASLVKEQFLISDTPKGRVRAGFPLESLEYILPNLYPVS
jgi:Fic family protein